jgi:5'-nucleotidase
MKILVTNDDSFTSPLFSMLVQFLEPLGTLSIVVPKYEQSWRGKSITAHDPVLIEEMDFEGHRAFCIDGTPADATNWGIYNASSSKPDLVVSGINIGLNTGLGFMLSSGTVGACLEANIAGLPALALSQEFPRNIKREQWDSHKKFEQSVISHIEQQNRAVLHQIFENVVPNRTLAPITWSANIPYQLNNDHQVIDASLGHAMYGSLFEKNGGHYKHRIHAVPTDSNEKSDIGILRSGNVSLTRIDIRDIGRLA